MTNTAITKKINQKDLKEGYGKIHDRIIDMSEETVEFTVENIEKWQKLFAKSLTASTPLVEKGIDMSFEVAETIFDQYKTGGARIKTLLFGGKNVKINKAAKKVKPATIKVQTPTAPTKASKLTDIKGIGPKIEGLLNKKGISSISELAEAKLSLLNEILDEAGPRFQMHDPKTWVKQAKAMLK